MLIRPRHRGFSLIELMITVAVLAAMVMVGLPAMLRFLQSSQIRTAAESMVAGMQYAKTEALRRNTQVRLSLVNDVTAACVLASNGTSWVVSLDDPAGACDTAPSEVTAPRILQARSGREGTANAELAASGGAGTNSVLIYNGLGRLVTTNADGFTQIDISNPNGGACEHAASDGTMRCLRIRVTAGGDARMCDPKVSDTTDPRSCG